MAVDQKNISRVDLNEIYKSVKAKSLYAIKGLNNPNYHPDEYAIFETDFEQAHGFAMEGMALLANNTHRVKYFTQSPIDALTNYQELEDPENDDSYNDPSDTVVDDETVTDPDGATILVKDISGPQFTPGEKLPFTDGETAQDTIQFELEEFPDSSGDATRTTYRYTVIQQLIKSAIEHYILMKWWKLHSLPGLSEENQREYNKMEGLIRANVTSFHNGSTTKLPVKQFYGI